MQLSLFYDYESIYKSSSFFQKYETLFLPWKPSPMNRHYAKAQADWGMDRSVFLRR